MTNQETCLDGLGREESRSIALVWRGRESVNGNERGLGFFFFFFNMGWIWIISIPYLVKLYLRRTGYYPKHLGWISIIQWIWPSLSGTHNYVREGKYAFMVLREYPIITLKLHLSSYIGANSAFK